jgi:serine/threonine protein kinase
MSADSAGDTGPLSEIDSARDRFEAEWRSGRRPCIEDYLAQASERARPALFGELLKLELYYRCERQEVPVLEEYQRRFSDFADQVRAVFQHNGLSSRPQAGMHIHANGSPKPGGEPPPNGDKTGPRDTVTRHPASTGAVAPEAQPAALPAVGEEFGGHRIEALLGEGGMGCVYRATDPVLRREVALKVMKPEVAARPNSRERFLREARALAALQHDHVAHIFQVGEADGVPFLTMPLLPGESLAARLKHKKVLPAAEVLRIGREAAEGLAAVHAAGLVHRDFKPSNLWLEPDTGRVKLLDFGLAREQRGGDGLTQEGFAVGTPEYMSPEQVDGQPLDGRSDLFSLGSVLYECATGRRPFAGTTHSAILVAVTGHQPPIAAEVNPSVPGDLSALIGCLLAKQAHNRPASAQDVAEMIRAMEAGRATDTASERLPARTTERGRKRSWRWVAAAAAVVLLGVVGYVTVKPPWGTRSTPPSPPPSEDPNNRVVTRTALTAKLDVRVWKNRDTSRGLALGDPGALPLQAGDLIRFEVRLDRPGYVYLIYVDANGQATPLYPWRRDSWDECRPETARDRLDLPDDPAKDAGPLSPGPSGIEAVLMLVRDKPLAEAERRQLAEGLAGRPVRPPAKPDLLRGVVWLGEQEGPRFSNAHDRGRPGFGDDQAVQAHDPVEQVRRLLRTRLQPHGGEARGVCFSFSGQP